MERYPYLPFGWDAVDVQARAVQSNPTEQIGSDKCSSWILIPEWIVQFRIMIPSNGYLLAKTAIRLPGEFTAVGGLMSYGATARPHVDDRNNSFHAARPIGQLREG